MAVLASGSKTIPNGSVTFMDNTTNKVLGTSPLFFGLTGFSYNLLSVGNHNITAVYVGNNNYATSTSKVVIQKVLAKTVCTWPVKPNPCNFGQTCTFKIHIGVQSPGTGNPTGNVTFYDGPKSIGTGSWSGDTAVLNCLLSAGSHSITAKYSGDNNFDGSTSAAVNQTVDKAGTTTILTSSAKSIKSGSQVTFTAKVSVTAPGIGNPSGTVTFKDSSTNKTLGTVVVNSYGQVVCSISSLSLTTHSIIAVYGGDGNFDGSTSNAINQVITK